MIKEGQADGALYKIRNPGTNEIDYEQGKCIQSS